MRPVLISFDLHADFGVFKKPDVNDGLQVTFNLLHKPALLGILGAIAGLEGYQQRGRLPVYYETLRNLRVGIEPFHHEKGNFAKTVIKYTNTVGYANADGNLIITEQTLRRPAYRCYLMPDLDNEVQARLHDRILAGEAEYLPYFGKNECSAWWEVESVLSYTFEQFQPEDDFKIESVFIREHPLRDQRAKPRLSPSTRKVLNAATFAYFERLPIDFFVGNHETKSDVGLDSSSGNDVFVVNRTKPLNFVQYDLAEFAFTDWVLQKDSVIHDLYRVSSLEGVLKIVQLF